MDPNGSLELPWKMAGQVGVGEILVAFGLEDADMCLARCGFVWK